MLKKALEYFYYGYGMNKAIVSVLKGNEASKKTILANGGRYLDTVFEENDKVTLERYEIEYQGIQHWNER